MGEVPKLLYGGENGYHRVALENTTCQGVVSTKSNQILLQSKQKFEPFTKLFKTIKLQHRHYCTTKGEKKGQQ